MTAICILIVITFTFAVSEAHQCRQIVTDCDGDVTDLGRAEKGDTGARGKAGPKGEKGEMGRLGLKGANGDLNEAFLAELNLKLEGLIKCRDGVVVGRICYRLPFRVGYRLDYNGAVNLCNFHGGVLAEIPTREVYDAVFHYVKITFSHDLTNPSNSHIGIWFGMEYQRGVARLRNGTGSFTSWLPGFPSGTSVNMGMKVFFVRSSESQGMWNHPSTHEAVPLCQFLLD